MSRLAAITSLVCFFASCATVKRSDLETLKPTITAFHQRIRFKDFGNASELIVPERRDAFTQARERANDDRDLSITDFELEDAKLSPDTLTAKVVSHISWFRLPSTTEKKATVTSHFVWRQSTWMLESQDNGPFDDLKSAPKAASKTPDAGTSN